LNDSSETTYATELFKSAIKKASEAMAPDDPGLYFSNILKVSLERKLDRRAVAPVSSS
jgi:hypothetical protein